MHILITGGTGLIGRALVADLTRSGHSVTVLTRRPERAAGRLPNQTVIHPWDAHTLEGWAHLIEEHEAVVNLAGESIAGETPTQVLTRRWTPDYKTRIRESRLRAGQLLMEAIQQTRRRPSVLIQASAVGYYGNVSDRDVDETFPAGNDFLAEVCRAWEASTLEAEALGIRRVVIRTGLVMASQGGILPLMLLPVKLFLGGPLGNGQQAVPWIHIADEVAAIRFLLEDDSAQGAYNLSAPQPITQAEFVRIAGQVLHRPSFFPTPGFLLRLALGEKASLVLEGQRAVPKRLLEAGFRFRFTDLEAALRDLI